MPDSQTDALLREVTRLYEQAQRTTAACCDNTTHTQCLVLTEMGRSAPITPLELGEKLGFEKSWMSRVIDRLVQEGLIAKTPNEHDGRSVLLNLTLDGKARLRDLNTTLNDHAERLMSYIPADERASVQRALLLLRDALRQDAQAGNVITLDAITTPNQE